MKFKTIVTLFYHTNCQIICSK